MNQAALGPSGQEAFAIFNELLVELSLVMKPASLASLVWRMDSVIDDLVLRTKTKAREADGFILKLKDEATKCQLNQWEERCVILQNEIESWIER